MTNVKSLKTFSIFACLLSIVVGACVDDDGDVDVMESDSSAGQGTAGTSGTGSTTDGSTMGTSGSTTGGGSTGTGSASTSSGTGTDDCMETGGTGGESLIPGVDDDGDCPEFVECIFSTCGPQVNQCFGDIANAMPGGECESYLQCLQVCSCNTPDPNCAANCFQNTDSACKFCLTGLGLCAATSCQEAKNACDESTGTGSTGGDTDGTTTGS